MFNQKLALYLCLVCLAAVLAAHAAPADVVAPATQPAPPTTDITVTDASDLAGLEGDMMAEAEEDEDEEDEYYDDEYEGEEFGEYVEEEESPEEELGELAEEHYMVKEDCRELAREIKQAQQSNSTVDPEMQTLYDECMKELKEIETDMAELTAEMEAADDEE